MPKRLSWSGVVVGVVLVVFVAVAATSARAPRPGEAMAVAGLVAQPLPPNCDEFCTEETACEEACRYGSDITCGEYAEYSEDPTCVSCSSTCTPYTPCDVQCLEGGSLTTCEGAGGLPPAENCSSVCVPSSVYCSTPCWNGSSSSTCGAEHYDCDDPCYEWTWDYSGVFEDNLHYDSWLEAWVVDCYARVGVYEWDACQGQAIRSLQCSPFLVGWDEPEGSCCDTYYYYGCQNWLGC